jgi:MFS family permease
LKLREEGWREVVRDRRLRHYVLAAVVLMIGGYGSQEAGYSLFVVNNLKLPVHVIGVIFFFNTTTIVCSQLWILNRIEGKSRTKVMATVAVIWFVFWVILDTALALPRVLAIVSLCVAMIIFALGETMLSPVGPALVNEIAPEHLRGRYNAAAGLAWGLSGTLAPAITAFYFNEHLGNWWPLGTGLTALVGGALMLRLRHLLSASEDGRVPHAATSAIE